MIISDSLRTLLYNAPLVVTHYFPFHSTLIFPLLSDVCRISHWQVDLSHQNPHWLSLIVIISVQCYSSNNIGHNTVMLMSAILRHDTTLSTVSRLWAGLPSNVHLFLAGAGYLSLPWYVETRSRAHPVSYIVGNGGFPRVKVPKTWSCPLTTLVPILRMCGSLHPLNHTPSWYGV